jgi:hypothetical protein
MERPMRTIRIELPVTEFSDGEAQPTLDWRADPMAVMEAIDKALEPFGLEIVLRDTHADYYEFAVDKRQ